MTPLPHRLVTTFLGAAACLTLNSCQNTGGGSGSDSGGVVDYTSPTSHMSKKEKESYAFDDSGKYRENWVAANSGAKVKNTSMSTDSPYVQDVNTSVATTRHTAPVSPPTSPAYADSPAYSDTPATTTKTTASTSSGARKSSSSSGSKKSTASNSSGSKKSTASTSSKSKKSTASSKKPASKSTPKPTVVTIQPGDTLSSYSRKTGVPVEKIKAYNGMKSDLLVDGKTIKIPPKKN